MHFFLVTNGSEYSFSVKETKISKKLRPFHSVVETSLAGMTLKHLYWFGHSKVLYVNPHMLYINLKWVYLPAWL